VVEPTEHLGLAQSTVSKHWPACGTVAWSAQSRRAGASVFSLTHPEAMLDLLSAAEHLLELTGDAVALCPVYGRAAH
jgi:hypothetical protein